MCLHSVAGSTAALEEIQVYSYTCIYYSMPHYTCSMPHYALYIVCLTIHTYFDRWSGRVRHKISTHVKFPMTFDLYPYYTPPPEPDVAACSQLEPADFLYDLAGVVEHQGTGLTSGHYAAYCWNTDAGIHVMYCNFSDY